MDVSECKRLGTYGPEQALIPEAAFVCTLLPKNVPCSFTKIPMLFHTSPGSDVCPTQIQVLQASLGAAEGNTSQGVSAPASPRHQHEQGGRMCPCRALARDGQSLAMGTQCRDEQ